MLQVSARNDIASKKENKLVGVRPECGLAPRGAVILGVSGTYGALLVL